MLQNSLCRLGYSDSSLYNSIPCQVSIFLELTLDEEEVGRGIGWEFERVAGGGELSCLFSPLIWLVTSERRRILSSRLRPGERQAPRRIVMMSAEAASRCDLVPLGALLLGMPPPPTLPTVLLLAGFGGERLRIPGGGGRKWGGANSIFSSGLLPFTRVLGEVD